jgi:hypothetical protein
MKTAAQKERERKEILRVKEKYRRHYEAIPKYELEHIGGPYAGTITHYGTNGFSDDSIIEIQPPTDANGRPVIPHSVYRYRNGAFHWVDPLKKLPPTKECPTCKGRGRVLA